MSSVKETPRQKMISMMYLVLYTLLALNVSKEVINTFVVVNDSIVLTNKSLSDRINDIYSGFAKNYEFNPGKVKPYWEKAKKVKALTQDMLQYVENIKYDLISKTEGISIDSAKNVAVGDLKTKDDYHKPTNYFLGNTDDGKSGEAPKLKTKIEDFKKDLFKVIDENKFKDLSTNLSTKGPYYNADKKEETWQIHYFYNSILAADIAVLNKLKSDIYNAEYIIVNHLYKSIGKGNFKFDKIEAKVLPKSDFVFLGNEYKAEVIIAAYDTTQVPQVLIKTGTNYLSDDQYKDASAIKGQPGKIMINLPAVKEGINKYAGIIRQTTATGQQNDYHFSNEFIVSKPTVTVSAKKMNVFYSGVKNPVSLSIAGIPKENVDATISAGSIKRNKNGNDWTVTVPSNISEVVVSVLAKVGEKEKIFDSKVFRVKDLPTPIATVAGRNSGSVNREIMLAAGALAPKMPDDFDFDQTYVITSFTMTIQRGFQLLHFKSNQSRFTTDMKNQIERTNKGQNIIFENIVAQDSNGKKRSISPIILTIN